MPGLNRLTSSVENFVRPLIQQDERPVAKEAHEAVKGMAGDSLAISSATREAAGRTFAHQDASLVATDGQAIAYRTTEPAGDPKSILVMQQGTLGKPEYFDQMGEELAKSGIKSYAIGSRVEAPDFRQHSQDLESVLEQARRENPGVPVTVGGVSLGAMIALDWSARHNAEHLPVFAMAPVVANKFLGIKDTLTVGGGLLFDRLADHPVDTPMSAGVPLTSNPASPEAHLADPEHMKVPARLFDDVAKMSGDIALKGHGMKGPLYVAMGGSDSVAVNGVTEAFTKLIGSEDKTLKTFPGAAHDLSQETNHPDLVEALRSFVLAQR